MDTPLKGQEFTCRESWPRTSGSAHVLPPPSPTSPPSQPRAMLSYFLHRDSWSTCKAGCSLAGGLLGPLRTCDTRGRNKTQESRREASSGPAELRGLVLITAPLLLRGPCSLKVPPENLPGHLGQTSPQPLETLLLQGARKITVLCTVPPKPGAQREPLRSDTL